MTPAERLAALRAALRKAGVDGFSWTRTPAQIRIEKLKT